MRLSRVSRTRSTNHRSTLRARNGEPIVSRARRSFLQLLLLFTRRDYETLRDRESFINPRRRYQYLIQLFFPVEVNQSDLRRRRNAEEETLFDI